uniref:Uncharacterized protein n=1 Tax=Ditylum brightwellii TaxID=49249 RepID=A0A6U3NS11_9STRA|mmetsp:Transcript_11070/g.16484  ORF Transcript_11070/g.16484 Transcript_11070/m.16484 type:complete len:168 (+) Transcript_11070:81-584(+)
MKTALKTAILLLSILCANVAAQDECVKGDIYVCSECCRDEDKYGPFCCGEPIPNCQDCPGATTITTADLLEGKEHVSSLRHAQRVEVAQSLRLCQREREQCEKYGLKEEKVTVAFSKVEAKVQKAHEAHMKKLAADEKAAAYAEKVAASTAKAAARLGGLMAGMHGK